jgi:hypothetical protein
MVSATPDGSLPALTRRLRGSVKEAEEVRSEKAVSLAFEIASYVSLQDAGPEAWGRKGATVATLGSSDEIRAAVKVGQYLLGPSPLTLANDLTKMLAEATRNINANRLKERVDRVFEAV